MISSFGLCIRKIRKKNNDTLRMLAYKLNVSPSFLSMMEVGRKTIPLDYVSKIKKVYILTEEEETELIDSINETNGNVDLEIGKMNDAQKHVSLLFARKINNADKDLIEKLKRVLEESSDGEN